jgi:serine/threonine protein kinase/uncharacterized membrane protein YgdD (TMEM256/DUF423 family)
MSNAAAAGRVIDSYRLIEVIGKGGFGKIYRAEDVTTGETVAIKILQSATTGDLRNDMRARFEREAAMAGKLAHPNTIRQIGFGETPEGELYLVLEFLDGKNLFEIIGEIGPLGDVRVHRIARDVLGALGEAHELGVVHRDLKPGNIMVTRTATRTNVTKVLDFGIAKMFRGQTDITQTGIALGSPRYMAPELFHAEPATPATDVYSLSITLGEALYGGEFFNCENMIEAAKVQLSPNPLPVPDSLKRSFLWSWLERGLGKDPEARYRDANEMLAMLPDLGDPSFAPTTEEAALRRSLADISLGALDRLHSDHFESGSSDDKESEPQPEAAPASRLPKSEKRELVVEAAADGIGAGRPFFLAAIVLGALTVILGAFGGHLVGSDAAEYHLWVTANQYAMFHVFGVFFCGWLVERSAVASLPANMARFACFAFVLGVLLFSGSLFLSSLSLLPQALGLLTPVGGLCLLTGWLLCAAALRNVST